MDSLKKLLSSNYNIQFSNESLLTEAFTHSSYANDHRKLGIKNLERLEFLGDAVIELSVSKYLYNKFPNVPEGQLTRRRAALVREESLANLAREAGFPDHIFLGKGEEQMNGRYRNALLCDVFEAFTGALYLDQGHEAVDQFLGELLFPKIEAQDFSYGIDYKTTLQELIQKRGPVRIEYRVVDSYGPDHDRKFDVEVLIESDVYGTGTGRSKKNAEQQAAKNALDQLK